MLHSYQHLAVCSLIHVSILFFRQPAADCVPPSSPSVRSQVCDSMETHPEALCHSSVLPGQQGREKNTAGSRKTQSSSLTNLPESTEPRTMSLKAKFKTVRMPPLVSDCTLFVMKNTIYHIWRMCINKRCFNIYFWHCRMGSCLQKQTVALWALRAVSSLLQYTVLSSRGQLWGMMDLHSVEHFEFDPVTLH